MSEFGTLARALRRWAAAQDPYDHAAVELLIEHETWLRRPDFVTAAVVKHGSVTAVSWREAREFCDSDPIGSTSQLAILDLAVALGENRFKFSIMGPAHSRMIATAVTRALGEDR